MSSEKQIEEMEKDIKRMCDEKPADFCNMYECHKCIATDLYNAGYREASEVAELEKQIEDLKVLLEMCQKSEEGMRELYHNDINALLEAKQKGEIAVAREIFEEIAKIIRLHDEIAKRDKSEYGELIVMDIGCALAELKKKYTEESK